MLTIFHVQNVLIILHWCLCEFLLLKHINEVHALHLDLSFTNVDIFLCAKCSYHSQLMLMWFSCSETYWWSVHTSSSFVIDWCWHFFCGKYSRISIVFLIIYWCWLFFMCKMFLSFSTDVYVSFCYWNISMKCMHFILICHLLMLTFFLCARCSYHSQLTFMWFSCTETYWWSGCTSSSFVI